MKHYFIINPVAGKGTAVQVFTGKIQQAFLHRQEPYEIHITQSVGDATNFVRETCKTQQGALRFYACGGDGTLCEAVNGAAGFPFASVTSVPCGSGNDFVRNFEGGFQALDGLIDAQDERIDLMRFADGAYGINMCNVGFDANVALNMAKFKSLPLVSGHMAYQLSLIYCLLQKMSYPLKVVLDDSEVIQGEFLFTTIGNGCYCGGGFKGVPDAVINDGLLDLCVVKKLSRPKFLSVVSIYKEGRHLQEKALEPYLYYRKARKIEVVSEKPFAVSIDGESNLRKNLCVEVQPGALRFASPSFAGKVPAAAGVAQVF